MARFNYDPPAVLPPVTGLTQEQVWSAIAERASFSRSLFSHDQRELATVRLGRLESGSAFVPAETTSLMDALKTTPTISTTPTTTTTPTPESLSGRLVNDMG